MLTRSIMKKKVEEVLQKNVEIGHASNLEWLEQPKIDIKEATTFHNAE